MEPSPPSPLPRLRTDDEAVRTTQTKRGGKQQQKKLKKKIHNPLANYPTQNVEEKSKRQQSDDPFHSHNSLPIIIP
jgi:hypothetical protein